MGYIVPYRDRYAHMMARKGLWMTNLVRSRFAASIAPKCGRCDTGKVENMAHIMVWCPGTKNMQMKQHQKVCEVIKEAIAKATPRGVAEAVKVYKNQEVG